MNTRSPLDASGTIAGIRDRGKVGLGHLLLFVMMVIVAVIATGILINSIGLLEIPSEQTSPSQQAPSVQIIETKGSVDRIDQTAVHTVGVKVAVSPTQETRDFADWTIEWFGPTGHTTLQYGATSDGTALKHPAAEFAVEQVQNPAVGHFQRNTATDHFILKIDADAITGGQGLPTDTTVAIKLTTPSGDTHFLTLETPSTFGTKTTVTL